MNDQRSLDINEAVKTFEKTFKVIRRHVKYEENPKLPLVCSGGVCRVGDVYPALYSSEDRAIEAWLDTALSAVSSKATTIEWISPPELVKLQMTMADMRKMHRMMTDRYVVKGQFKTNGKQDDQES